MRVVPEAPRPAYYVTALDRLGLAVLAGGLLAGTLALSLIEGGRTPIATLGLWLTATIVAMLGIVTLGGPVWFALHRRGKRGPAVAAACGGVLALALFALVQMTGGTGGGYRLASALATSVPIALVAAAIGAVMHRIAYRRLL